MSSSARYAHVPIPEGYAALPPAARAVWDALCYHQRWEDGKPVPLGCFPSYATMAKTAGVSTKTIQRGVKQLEQRGWILRVLSRFGSAIDSTHYVLLAAGQTMPGKEAESPSGQKVHGQWTKSPRPRTKSPPNNINITIPMNTRGVRPPGGDRNDDELRRRAEERKGDEFFQ